jgi:putative phosphoesterase
MPVSAVRTRSLVGSGGRRVRVGVISDTHGLLRPEALKALRGSDLIIHAGDVGNPEVIDRLRRAAPTFAVRGNNDRGAWSARLPPTASIQIDEIRVYVLHELARLDLDPIAAGISVVVSGHSHRPSIERRDGILYLNPGSAGPRRFTLPVSLARLSISGRHVRSTIVKLAC